MNNHSEIMGGLLLVMGTLGVVEAATFTENGEAGESLATAQVTTGTGSLTTINGTLIDLGNETDDIDIFKIYVSEPGAFSVTATATLSVDNDAMMYLFDAAGSQVLFNDDDGTGLLPQFSAGLLAGESAGIYYLAFNLFISSPEFTDGALSGWSRSPNPFQTGPYSLALTGVDFATSVSSVPVPAAVWLFGSGLVGLVGIGRRV